MTNKFTHFDGDNLDNYLGHEMIEIKENYVKSKLNVEFPDCIRFIGSPK